MDDSDRKIILDSVDDAIREIFIEYDKGKLGWITTDEFHRMTLKMTENLKGPKVTPEVVQKLIIDFGGDGGRLSRQQLQKYLNSVYGIQDEEKKEEIKEA